MIRRNVVCPYDRTTCKGEDEEDEGRVREISPDSRRPRWLYWHNRHTENPGNRRDVIFGSVAVFHKRSDRTPG